jgi:hypothetical protein
LRQGLVRANPDQATRLSFLAAFEASIALPQGVDYKHGASLLSHSVSNNRHLIECPDELDFWLNYRFNASTIQ